MAELWLVRHAQASFQAEDYDRLSPLGEQQSRWLGEHFAARGLAFDGVVTGTLRRHRQTLDGIVAGMGVQKPPHVELPGLDEYEFRALTGAYERLEPDHPLVAARRAAPHDKPAFYRVLRLALEAWAANELPAPLPETWDGFIGRVESAARELQALSRSHARLLAVSSGGAMSALLGGRLGLGVGHIVDINLQVRNTSVSHFFLNERRFLLASWNAVPHLETPGRSDAITYG